MANITVRTDEQTKAEVEELFKELGISVSSAINLFLKQAIKERGLPFKPTAKTAEEKYNEYFNPHNLSVLAKSQEQIAKGQVIYKTLAELEEMTNG